jgi:A/G-specific adenine glycosylase
MLGQSTDFAKRLRRWYQQHRRDLPWRLPKGASCAAADSRNAERIASLACQRDPLHPAVNLNPYYVLVSEAMLQQTQVATVVPYFERFLQQFPTIAALADANPQDVLRAWQGLGYYSRARNLHAAAQQIVSEFGGEVPATTEQLLKLPGIGRYTAGAVASIAFEQRAPILDGNVARVLCRLDAVRSDPREPRARETLWARAEEILPRKNIGDFNSALMELGALICTPRSPQCLLCPVRASCEANAAGLQDKIPSPKKAKETPLLNRWTFCIRDKDRYLVEQRPPTGRWAGMWQFATLEAAEQPVSPHLLQTHYSLRVTEPVLLNVVEHALTHRRYRFDVFGCENLGKSPGDWATLQELNDRPMPRPHLKIREMLLKRAAAPSGNAP